MQPEDVERQQGTVQEDDRDNIFDHGEREEGDIAQDSHDAQWQHRLHIERGKSEKRCHPGGELSGCHGHAPLLSIVELPPGILESVGPGLPGPRLLDTFLLRGNLPRFDVSGNPWSGRAVPSARQRAVPTVAIPAAPPRPGMPARLKG
jgi:hypothetical protein